MLYCKPLEVIVPIPQRKSSPLLILVGYLAASGLAAFFGGYFTSKATITTFYAALAKPVWAPPSWLFAPVWSLLYLSMSLAIWLVWRKKPLQPSKAYVAAHTFWWVQLSLNALWPVIFWLQPAGLAACAACALLEVAIIACIITFQPISRSAAVLMLPYAAWVSFATVLSWALWHMNRLS